MRTAGKLDENPISPILVKTQLNPQPDWNHKDGRQGLTGQILLLEWKDFPGLYVGRLILGTGSTTVCTRPGPSPEHPSHLADKV